MFFAIIWGFRPGNVRTQGYLGKDARPQAVPAPTACMTDTAAKLAARAQVAELVVAFKHNEADYLRAPYNETQARTDFITPLLKVFGWDVYNAKGYRLALREVIEEATVEVGKEKLHKKPDYELRLARQRKLFVEAKKPSVDIEANPAAAFQTRRYGFQRASRYRC